MNELHVALADLVRDPRYLAHNSLEAGFLQQLLVQLDFVLASACRHIGTQDADELIATFQEYVS